MADLYTTLFNLTDNANHNQEDIALEIINANHGHTDVNNISQYYDIHAYNKLIPPNSSNLNILHINSRSLSKNIDNISAFLSSLSTPPDILVFTETWLNDSNKHLYQLLGYNSHHLVRTTRTQGGVSVYVSQTMKSEQLQELTTLNDSIEINTIKVTAKTSTYTICGIYRPHKKHEAVDEFTVTLSTLLQNSTIKKHKTILIGDLNINLLEHTTHTATNNFLSTLQTLNFFPHISRPTRFPDSLNLGEPSLLDHIYTNTTSAFISGIIHYPISDHLPIFLNISSPIKSHVLHKIQFRPLTETNKLIFSNKLNDIEWSDIFGNDVNLNFDKFLQIIHEIYNKSFPIRTKYISEKRLNNPWITQAVINSIKTKNNLYKDFKVGIVTEDFYKQYRNTLSQTIRRAKQSYYFNMLNNFKNDTKKIWMIINQLTNKKHKTTNIDDIIFKNKKLNDPLDIAKAFNEFYANIAPDLDRTLPPSSIDPLNFLKGDYPNSMVVLPVHHQEVIQVINSLKNKSNGARQISTSIIKDNKIQLSIPLTILFNQSINTGKFPQCLKHATVIPIHKKGPADVIGNYRPISLLNTFSKIFEKLMKKSLLNFLESKNIIDPRQFGFRAGRNTFSALKTFTEDIYAGLDSQDSILSIYIDFSKAFDTVKHDILLNKLQHYGIRGTINAWFRDYLSNRTQSTKISDFVSPPLTVQYGVPQGSVLGPILFLIYINDISSIFNNLQTILFADDSTFYIRDSNPSNLIHIANLDLNIFKKWCLSNRLTVNLGKTYYMLFTNKSINSPPPLVYDNNTVTKTDKHTILGVTIDDKMTFKPHIDNLMLKLSRVMSLLYRVRDNVPNNIMTTLYHAHVLPHLHYCIPIWCSTYPTHLLPLFKMQKRIIRIITNSDFYAHTQPLFKESSVLKLFDINKLEIAVYMFKIFTTQNVELPQHNYPTRTQHNIRIPRHNLTLFQHSLSYLAPKTWNAIPDHIKNLPSVFSFKKNLKKYILDQY